MVGLALVLPAAFAFASVIIKHMYTVVLFISLGGFCLVQQYTNSFSPADSLLSYSQAQKVRVLPT